MAAPEPFWFFQLHLRGLPWNKVPAGVWMCLGARSGWFQGLIRSGVGLETGKCMQVAGSSQAQKLGSQPAFHTPRGSPLLRRMHISATWWLSSCWGPGTMIFTFTCIISFCAFCLMNSFSVPYDNEQRVWVVKKCTHNCSAWEWQTNSCNQVSLHQITLHSLGKWTGLLSTTMAYCLG